MAKILHSTCQRFFAGDGCVGCGLNHASCDHQGFIPQGCAPPPLTNPPLLSKRARSALTTRLGGGSDSNIVKPALTNAAGSTL